MSNLRLRLREALRAAMKARDLTAVAALRTTLGAIDNAEAVDVSDAPSPKGGVIAGAVAGLGAGEVTPRALSERRIASIVQAEVAERQSVAADYERTGRHDFAARLRAEAAVLIAHLDNG